MTSLENTSVTEETVQLQFLDLDIEPFTFNGRKITNSSLADHDIRIMVESMWSARLEMCQWRRETLDKESIWDEGRSTSLSRW